jgi:PTH2 family peptidyl-tRNA hydrolase
MKSDMLDVKQVIIIRKDLNMRKGKIAAQAAHASLSAVLLGYTVKEDILTVKLNEATKIWLAGNFKKICVSVNSELELIKLHGDALQAGLICALIHDDGLTEFHGVRTLTALAIGPAASIEIDALTKDLPLL